MAFKNDKGLLDKIADDEPIFILRAQDVSASKIVLRWIAANSHLRIDGAKVKEALKCASDMQNWITKNGGKAAD